MVTSGSPSPIRVSQKRLTAVLLVIGVIGSLALGLLWWDSQKNATIFSGKYHSICVYCSSFHYSSQQLVGGAGWGVKAWKQPAPPYKLSYFPRPLFASGNVAIPIYLILLTYLATLLLIWLALMNRLARREFVRQGVV